MVPFEFTIRRPGTPRPKNLDFFLKSRGGGGGFTNIRLTLTSLPPNPIPPWQSSSPPEWRWWPCSCPYLGRSVFSVSKKSWSSQKGPVALVRSPREGMGFSKMTYYLYVIYRYIYIYRYEQKTTEKHPQPRLSMDQSEQMSQMSDLSIYIYVYIYNYIYIYICFQVQ